MNLKIHSLRLVTLALLCGPFLAAQPADDTQLKQVIIFGRHGVRSPVLPNSALNFFSAALYPTFTDTSGNTLDPAVITPHGGTIETLLGGYFHLWLKQEGLLTGNDSADANFVYFRATDTPLITDTAKFFWTGLLPAGGLPNINVVPATTPCSIP